MSEANQFLSSSSMHCKLCVCICINRKKKSVLVFDAHSWTFNAYSFIIHFSTLVTEVMAFSRQQCNSVVDTNGWVMATTAHQNWDDEKNKPNQTQTQISTQSTRKKILRNVLCACKCSNKMHTTHTHTPCTKRIERTLVLSMHSTAAHLSLQSIQAFIHSLYM